MIVKFVKSFNKVIEGREYKPICVLSVILMDDVDDKDEFFESVVSKKGNILGDNWKKVGRYLWYKYISGENWDDIKRKVENEIYTVEKLLKGMKQEWEGVTDDTPEEEEEIIYI